MQIINGIEYEYSAEEIRAAFSKSLKELRNYTQFTLKEMAKILDMPFQSIARYEKCETEPSLSNAYKIVEAFNLSIEDFIIYGIDGKINFENETIVERFNENIANLVFELGDNSIRVFQEKYPKLNIKEIVEEYS